MIQLADEIIWKSCLKGDRGAFENLYKRYYPLLCNYGLKISPDKELVQDCIQNLFIKFIQNHKNLSETTSVKGYILKAFRNYLYDQIKQQRIKDHLFDSRIDDILLFEKEPVHYSEEDELPEEYMIIRFSFAELSPRQREILYLYYVMDINHTDISIALNMNYQSSKNLLCRSLIKLRDLYVSRQNKSVHLKELCIKDLSYDFDWLRIAFTK